MKNCYRRIAAVIAAWFMFSLAWAVDYPSVWDIVSYNGSEAFVYETKSGSWYALNNKSVYERWGVVEQVSNVNDATFYPGKYVRVQQVIYKYADGWTPTSIQVAPFTRPANGVYVVDKGGHAVAAKDWHDSSNSSRTPMAIAIISNNTAAIVSLNDAKGNRKLEIWSKPNCYPVEWGENGLVSGVATTPDNYSNSVPGSNVLNDYAGVRNTALILAGLSNPPESAVSMAASYVFENGVKGYLPALGELEDLKKNLTMVNEALEMVGGEYIDGPYWSSSQHYLDYRAWSAFVMWSQEWAVEYFAQLRNNHTPLSSSYPDQCYFFLRPFGALPEYVFDYPYPSSPAADDTQYLYGDVDGNGSVDVDDLNIQINIMLGKDDADRYGGRALLCHGDFVDIADVNMMINILLGKPHAGPRAIIVSDKNMEFSGKVGEVYTQTITIKGDNLCGDVNAEVLGGDGCFSVTPTSVSLAELQKGAELTVTYSPSSSGSHTAQLRFTSEDAEPVTVTVTGTATSGELEDKTFTVNGVTFKMIAVEGGTFMMGATAEQGSDAYSDEKPAHQVAVSSYAIGETEVTQALWVAVMGSNPSYFPGNLQRPMEQVSWNACQTFITTLNQLTGANFRLPTEAEWEFAARGGNKSKGYKYAGSNTIGDVAWYTSNSGSTTHPVATKAANELGLYDMSGNVWEWCQDWYNNSYYSSSPSTNPTGSISGSSRVIRGGSWTDDTRLCRVSNRNCIPPSNQYGTLGLRLAMDGSKPVP